MQKFQSFRSPNHRPLSWTSLAMDPGIPGEIREEILGADLATWTSTNLPGDSISWRRNKGDLVHPLNLENPNLTYHEFFLKFHRLPFPILNLTLFSLQIVSFSFYRFYWSRKLLLIFLSGWFYFCYFNDIFRVSIFVEYYLSSISCLLKIQKYSFFSSKTSFSPAILIFILLVTVSSLRKTEIWLFVDQTCLHKISHIEK